MKYILLVSLFISVLGNNCQDHKGDNFLEDSNLQGFLFINISDIYHNGGEIEIHTEKNKLFLSIQGSKIVFDDSEYDLIEDEHVYRKSIEAEAFFPEYGLFVLKCFGNSDTHYKSELNNNKVLIPIESRHVEFKSLESYILDTYPVPTETNPLRVEPDENAAVVSDHMDYTYNPVEIKGDWVKIKDDKECYSGEFPSEKDITGWIRWRKDGRFMLTVAYTC